MTAPSPPAAITTTPVTPGPRFAPWAASLVTAITLIGVGVPLLVFAAVGWFSRYAADDYCTASQVALAGFVQAQSNLYVSWSGRFAATLLITLVELLGVGAVPLLAGVALAVWLAVATWTIRQLTHLRTLTAALLSALLIYATLQATADMPQNLYWQTGLITYLLPLILATVFVGWLARFGTTRPGLLLVVPFLLTLIAGGTSETFAAFQVAGLALGCALALVFDRRRLPTLVAGMAGGLVALVLIAIAPGNEVRQDTASRLSLWLALPQAIDFTRGWLRLTFARPHAVELVLLIAVPFVIAIRAAARGPRLRVFLPILALSVALLLLACMLPAFYALGSNPPGRAQLIPEYLLLAGVGAAAWCLGASLSKRVQPTVQHPLIGGAAALALLVLLALGPVRTATQSVGDLSAARAYASRWDDMDRQVRADRDQGVSAVTIPLLASTGSVRNLEFIGPDRNDWFNQCVAGYYRVSSIAASPDG